MKTVTMLVFLILSGCASISEYDQGCRDGIRGVWGSSENKEDFYAKYCDKLDAVHNFDGSPGDISKEKNPFNKL